MKPGEKIDNYTLLCECGKGAFGQVFLAQRNDGKHVAFKVVSLFGQTGDRELQALESYRKCPPSESLLKIYDLVIQQDHNLFYYTMELADNILGDDSREYIPATLSEVLSRDKKLNVLQTTELITQLLDGLSIIHANNLVHRDIKPANIIWVNGRAKLTDIGLMANNLSGTYRAGSDGFFPPMGSCIPDNSTTVDLYALTRVIYCCLTGKTVANYPEIDRDDVENFQGAQILKLMLSGDEELVKMTTSDFQQILREPVLPPTAVCSVVTISAGRVASSKREGVAKKYDYLSSLPSLCKISSADSWIRKQKLTKRDFLTVAAAGIPMAAVVGAPLALLTVGGFLLGKYLRNKV